MWEILGNAGDFVGGIAVVASLIYVGFQVRSARKQMHASALQDRIATRIALWSYRIDPEALRSGALKLMALEREGHEIDLETTDRLDDLEKLALRIGFVSELIYFQNLFYQRRHSLIEADQSLPLDEIGMLQSAAYRNEWTQRLRESRSFPPDFIEHVDRVARRWAEACDPSA